MDCRWIFRDAHPEAEETLRRELTVSRLLARLLANRGIHSAEAAKAYLEPNLHALHEPRLFLGMDAAVARIGAAVEAKQRITLYSDYDVDGVTGTAILYHFFDLLEVPLRTYIPERQREGYGLNEAAIERIVEDGCDLLITVDCGIRGLAPVARANELGLDVIVTDHHEPGPELPAALAVINHKQPGCPYPFKGLCGAGVAFKLAWGLAQQLSGEDTQRVSGKFRDYLIQAMSLAALGTIADIVPLEDENRILATWGLKCLPHSRFAGLRSLIAVADLAGKPVTAESVAFRLGPRLNAAGRMGSAKRSLDLLTTTDGEAGTRIAEELGRENTERQRVERRITAEAIEQAIALGLDKQKVIVLADQSWHPGVVGIVASRLVERFHRPAVLIALDGDGGRGSARSVPGFHLLGALLQAQEHLERLGGHAAAAGMEIATDKVEAFREALQRVCAETLDDDLLVPRLSVDVEASFGEIDGRLVEELRRLEPTGEGNPAPVLATRGVEVVGVPQQMGQDGKHLALYLKHDGRSFRAIAWGRGPEAVDLSAGDRLDVAYVPQINEWRGQHAVELHLKDFQRADA